MKIKSVGALICALVYSHIAWSWGDLGHSAVGEIAERNLTPKAKTFVQSIIGIEPLAIAATWPDHVRDDKRFKGFTPYHFWDLPPGSSFAEFPDSQRGERDAHTIVSQAPELLVSDKLNIKQKQILLRYFIHILGDVHQPLHLGHPIDQGGNHCEVKMSAEAKPTNLHSVWDSQIIEKIKSKSKSTGYFTYNDLVSVILKDVKAPRKVKGTPLEWYDETRKLLVFAYPDGKENVKPEDRPYCRQSDPVSHKKIDGKYDATKVPVLDEKFFETAIPLVEKQILLGGLRLAHLLNKMAENSNVTGHDDEQKIISEILIKNDLSANRTPQSKPKK